MSPGPTLPAGDDTPIQIGRWHVVDPVHRPVGVEPVDPLEGRVFDRIDSTPRSVAMDHFRLEQPDDGFSQGVVIPISDSAY